MLLTVYLVLINIMTFLLFGEDKRRARRQEWRVPERTLLILSALGGSLGALTGMLIFHHKTKKWVFRIAVPVFLLIHVIAIYQMYSLGYL